MKILITGATGFVGKHLVKYLKDKHKLYILVRSDSDYSSLCVKQAFTFVDNIDQLA